MEFIIGLILLGAGLFILSNKVIVASVWYTWSFLRLGGHNFSNGLVIIPLIIGIIMLVYNPKSTIAKIISILGAVFIVLTIIMGVDIRFVHSTLFEYILMLGLIASGAGLLIRAFAKKNR